VILRGEKGWLVGAACTVGSGEDTAADGEEVNIEGLNNVEGNKGIAEGSEVLFRIMMALI
jgi:hypothetical protein